MAKVILANDKLIAVANPALTVAGAYSIGDYVGTTTTPMEFTVAQNLGGYGEIVGAILIDKALQSLAGELWLFDADPTVPVDNAAWTITDAKMLSCFLGVIPIITYYLNAANSIGIWAGNPVQYKCTAALKKIYGAYVTRGAPTYASLDLYFKLNCALLS
jgi:hypothetical protein